jgi:arylsulfatase A-like enzyme
VAYAYISDVHDNHAGGGAYGPGEAGYVAALKSYDDAFGAFFNRLSNDGINSSNTLFVVTADENDHYAGQQAQNCDGVNTPCVYNTTPGLATGGKPQHGIFDVTSGGTTPFSAPAWPPSGANTPNGPLVGEVGYNIKWPGLIGPSINNTGYDISFDSAPSFYINGQPQAIDSNGDLAVNPTLRAFEGAAANLNAFDPYIDSTQLTPVARYLVDYPTLKAIHMINTDPRRNMSFTMFSQPDYFFNTGNACPAPSQGCVNDSFAWIHGDYSEDIGRTWLGMAGPGVANGGRDDTTWTDHTDVVPTINALLGLKADYQADGRVISQALKPSAAKGLNGSSFTQLGGMLKQLDAPYGAFNHSLIVASTAGIKADDTTYLGVEQQIQDLASQRDALVDQIQAVLNGLSSGHQEQLIHQGQNLLDEAAALAGS